MNKWLVLFGPLRKTYNVDDITEIAYLRRKFRGEAQR